MDIFHDCNRVAWYWDASGIGKDSGRGEVRGVHLLYTIENALADVADGVVDEVEDVADAGYGGRKVNMVMFEFDSLGWAEANGSEVC